MKVTDRMIYAFAGEPEITGTDAYAIEVGLRAVFAEVDRQIEETHEPWCQGCNAPHQIKGDE